jgi:hypothetical protein
MYRRTSSDAVRGSSENKIGSVVECRLFGLVALMREEEGRGDGLGEWEVVHSTSSAGAREGAGARAKGVGQLRCGQLEHGHETFSSCCPDELHLASF